MARGMKESFIYQDGSEKELYKMHGNHESVGDCGRDNIASMIHWLRFSARKNLLTVR
jgi:hypothetical protein